MDLSGENNAGFRLNRIPEDYPFCPTEEEIDNILEEMSKLLSEDDMVGVRNIISNMSSIK